MAIFLYDIQNLLKATEGWSKNPIIVTIPEDAVEVIVNPTASFLPPEEEEKFVDIKAIQDPAQNLALANPIGETETSGEDSVPSNISKLETIDGDHESDENPREVGFEELHKK